MESEILTKLCLFIHFIALPFMIESEASYEKTLEEEEVCLMLAPTKKFRYYLGPSSSQFMLRINSRCH